MANKNISILLVYGGQSTEHEVSRCSARFLLSALEESSHKVFPVSIAKNGVWRLESPSRKDTGSPLPVSETQEGVALTLREDGKSVLIDMETREAKVEPDVIFPALHGLFGEDGSLQGVAKMMGLPCVGAGILGSSVGMDKDVMKRLLREAGLPIGGFAALRRGSKEVPSYADISKHLGDVVYIKPANFGSSVGVTRADNAESYEKGIEEAFRYEPKIIIEENISGRELECALLGNDDVRVTSPGEIILNSVAFYSYDSKYTNDNDASLTIPADIPEKVSEEIRDLAVKAYKILECRGMARMDFFLKDEETVIINEINTLPGFTSISMYPKLWEQEGISAPELAERLVTLAIEEFEANLRK